jgi:hypothetical protein
MKNASVFALVLAICLTACAWSPVEQDARERSAKLNDYWTCSTRGNCND